MTGIEPVTSSLPRKCSTSELHRHKSGRRDSNPRPTAWKAVALPTELRPLIYHNKKWGEQDSNLRRHKSTDLQSAPVDRFGIPPYLKITIFCLLSSKVSKIIFFFIYYKFLNTNKIFKKLLIEVDKNSLLNIYFYN